MILKKPYAFLIKHFRLIHMILTAFLVFCAYKILNINNFFNNYVQNGYRTSVTIDLEKIYTPVSLFLLVFAIIVFTVTILVLMIHKKKPNKLYIFMVVYYLVMFLGLFYLSFVFQSFEQTLLSSTTSRSIRDILIIYYIPQIIFIIYTALRAVGFNLKKFDFVSDLKEMDYSAKDAEEFEINVNLDSYKAGRTVRRFSREIVYYIKENKFIVICIGVILAVILGFTIYNNINVNYDKTYSMNREFTYNKAQVTIMDAMMTNTDYNGNIISDGKYYLVLKTKIVNNSGYVIKMDYNNFKLEIGGNLINPTVNLAKNFIDYAPSIVPTSISHKSDVTFSLVYELDRTQINKNLKLVIYNGVVYEKEEVISKYIYVKIKNKKIIDTEINGNYQTSEQISFEDTFLNESSLVIDEFNISKSYLYYYEKCDETNCSQYTDLITVPVSDNRQDNKLLILNVTYYQDHNSFYSKSYESLSAFVENFMDVQYRINGKTYTKSINVTPQNVNNIIVLEVPSNIEQADIIQIVVTIRNQKYIINLKS